MSKLSHFDAQGGARMVDVGTKAISERSARAMGCVSMQPATLELIKNRQFSKGDVLEVARLAGIMAAKRTSELIPLCHTLPLDSVQISFDVSTPATIEIQTIVKVQGRTGVEMEALTAVAVTALTIYDMCKSVDRDMTIGEIRLEEKLGGRSGHWKRST